MTTAVVDPGEAVAALRAAVEQVLAAGWWRAGDPQVREAVVEVEREAARLEAARLRLLAEADARDVGAAVGAPSTAEWFAAATTSRRQHAGERVTRAVALNGPLAATGAALAAAAITPDAAAVIHRAMGRMPSDLDAGTRASAEAFLIEQAALLDPAQLARVAAVLRVRLTPDAGEQAERDEDADLAAEEVTLVQDDDGRWHLHGTLSATSGATLAAALDPLSAPEPAVGGVPDSRPARQRRAQALTHLAACWLAGQAGTESCRPRVTLTVAFDTVFAPDAPGAAPAIFAGGAPASPATLATLCCDAEVSPVLVDGAGVPLDVGRTVYAFPDRIRRAIIARDGGCTFTGCTRPPAWCHVHHLVPFSAGGTTSERSGALVCGFHHRIVHRHGWRGELSGSQVIWHPPDRSAPHVPPPPWAPAMHRLVHRWRQQWTHDPGRPAAG